MFFLAVTNDLYLAITYITGIEFRLRRRILQWFTFICFCAVLMQSSINYHLINKRNIRV